MEKWCLTYAKYNKMETFRAFDLNEGYCVSNIIYATQIENTKENQEALQHIADINKDLNLILQLRDGKKVVFQTK